MVTVIKIPRLKIYWGELQVCLWPFDPSQPIDSDAMCMVGTVYGCLEMACYTYRGGNGTVYWAVTGCFLGEISHTCKHMQAYTHILGECCHTAQVCSSMSRLVESS